MPSDNRHYENVGGKITDIEGEIPFEIPENWIWARMKSVCFVNPRTITNDNTEVSFVPMSLISDGFFDEHRQEIRFWSDVKTGYTHFENGDIGIAKITPCFENRKSVIFNNLKNGIGAGTTELHILRTTSRNDIFAKYILWFVKTNHFILSGQNKFSGTAGQLRINKFFIDNMLLPLPPLSEQRRIVESLKTLFSLIDKIEFQQADLQTLTNDIQKRVLDLAIQGKLVPQDPNDEPASALLDRIRTEKEMLIKQGKIKRDKSESSIYKGADNCYYQNNEHIYMPFDIPNSWTWSRGNECFLGMTTKRPNGDFFRYIDINSIDNKKHIIKNTKKLSTLQAPSRASRELFCGDIIFSLVRPYLENIALVNQEYSDCIASTGFYVCRPSKCLLPEYLYFLMISRYVVDGLNFYMKGNNSPSIRSSDIETYLFPIPPLQEQSRIIKAIKHTRSLLRLLLNTTM